MNSEIINKVRKLQKRGTNCTVQGRRFQNENPSWGTGHSLAPAQLGTCTSGDANFLLLCTCPQITVKKPQALISGLQLHLSRQIHKRDLQIMSILWRQLWPKPDQSLLQPNRPLFHQFPAKTRQHSSEQMFNNPGKA